MMITLNGGQKVKKKNKKFKVNLVLVKKKDEIPDWVSDEIQNAKFKKPEEVKKLDIFLNFMM